MLLRPRIPRMTVRLERSIAKKSAQWWLTCVKNGSQSEHRQCILLKRERISFFTGRTIAEHNHASEKHCFHQILLHKKTFLKKRKNLSQNIHCLCFADASNKQILFSADVSLQECPAMLHLTASLTALRYSSLCCNKALSPIEGSYRFGDTNRLHFTSSGSANA